MYRERERDDNIKGKTSLGSH